MSESFTYDDVSCPLPRRCRFSPIPCLRGHALARCPTVETARGSDRRSRQLLPAFPLFDGELIVLGIGV